MDRGTEKRVWEAIRGEWEGHAVRVEASAGGVDPGTPDAVMSLGGRGIWVELKVWPGRVSPEQLAWHIHAIQRGAGAVVFCSVGRGRYWVGMAEEYTRLERKPEGSDLKSALEVIQDYIWGYL